MSRSLKNSPQQLRILALADRAGMTGVRLADIVAGEMALLLEDQRTKARKHVITANVLHALKKLAKRGIIAVFCAPSERYYVSTAALQAADVIEQQKSAAPVIVPSLLNPPNEQQAPLENQLSPQTKEDWLETIARECAAAAQKAMRDRG